MCKRKGVIRKQIGIGIIKRIRIFQNNIPISFNRIGIFKIVLIGIPVFCTNIRFKMNILLLISLNWIR